jgi:TrmH family RNA methyltransferase
MSSSKSPSGLLAVFSFLETPSPEKLSSGIVLANITNPGNMGTLIRSCAAFGYKSVVVVDGCDIYSPKVVQSTAGTLPLVNIFKWTWEQLLEYKKDLKLCALVVKDGKSYKDLDLDNLLYVVGNEAHGIKPEWIETCDSTMTLPMSGSTESLNASVAGSLALSLKSL